MAGSGDIGQDEIGRCCGRDGTDSAELMEMQDGWLGHEFGR